MKNCKYDGVQFWYRARTCPFFRRFGEVKDVRIMYHNDTGRSRRFGFVTFEDPETLEAVIKFPGGHDVDGKKVSQCLTLRVASNI